MGLSLNRPAKGSTAWFDGVDANWNTLEEEFVARQKSDASTVTVSGTTSETALMAATTIPADALQPGVVLVPWSIGSITIPALSTPQVTWRLRWGGIAGTVLVTWTWNFGSSGSAYTLGWATDYRIVGLTAGASGTARVDGWMLMGATPSAGLYFDATIDTTADKVLLWTVQSNLSTVSVAQDLMVTNRG